MDKSGNLNTQPSIIKVIVVEDNKNIREGLKTLIDGTPEYICLATYPECETMIENIKTLSPDVLLIDIGLPGMSGIEGIKKVKTLLPDLPVIVLTVYNENELIFNALCAGANGYITKKTPSSRLLNAIRDAYEGWAPMSSNIAMKVIELFNQRKQPVYVNGEDKLELSPREKEILNMLIEGSSYKAIADFLLINIENLRYDFSSIYKKLHAYSQS